MALIKITIIRDGYRCERCNHEWLSRANKPNKLPVVCPDCGSPYWNIKKK